jgi:hypothetical protein
MEINMTTAIIKAKKADKKRKVLKGKFEVVGDEKRVRWLEEKFGKHCVRFEQTVLALARQLASEYQGGYWEFMEVKEGVVFEEECGQEGAVFLGLKGNEEFEISNQNSQSMTKMDGFGFGLYITFLAVNDLMWKFQGEEKFITYYHALKNVIIDYDIELYSLID